MTFTLLTAGVCLWPTTSSSCTQSCFPTPFIPVHWEQCRWQNVLPGGSTEPFKTRDLTQFSAHCDRCKFSCSHILPLEFVGS